MRQFVLLLIVLVGMASPSWAAPAETGPVTVAQLGQWLAGAHGQSDGKIAKELGGMNLTEQVSPAQLARWQSALPGRNSREALTALADVSAFLDPPATDMLAAPPPDLKAQGAIFSSAIDYVVNTLAKLPDFSATRTTLHFQDAPAHSVHDFHIGLGQSYITIPYAPLRRTTRLSTSVSYVNGAEVWGSREMDSNAINQPGVGLTTAGEFGPILSVVLNDAVHGTITWGYWEQSPFGKLAVFRYSVALEHSSYVVALKSIIGAEKLSPAYHGEIAIDPSTGAILHITLQASSLLSRDILGSAIAVDYGTVQLGSKDYICPLKGVAILKLDLNGGEGQAALQTQVNDIAFTGYHLLRGDVTILPAQP